MSGRLERSPGFRSLEKLGSPKPNGGGGSFSYDEAIMRALIKKWLDVADRFHNSANRLDIHDVSGPGLDFASAGQARATTMSAAAYHQYLTKNFEYCVRQAQLLQNTLDDYLGVEHHNVAEVFKTAGQVGI